MSLTLLLFIKPSVKATNIYRALRMCQVEAGDAGDTEVPAINLSLAFWSSHTVKQTQYKVR